MNLYDLRNCILVITFSSHSNGAVIYYRNKDKSDSLNLNNTELLSELIAIGSLEDTLHDERAFPEYQLSQWDALNIAIRFELARETEKDIDDSDIGKAIDNITK